MGGRFAAPVAVFLELYLPLNLLLVLMGIVRTPFADGAAQSDKGVRTFELSHDMGEFGTMIPENA